jgi:hypothetical protein
MYFQACRLLNDEPCRQAMECMAAHAGMLRAGSENTAGSVDSSPSCSAPSLQSSLLWKERGWLQCALLSNPGFLRHTDVGKPGLLAVSRSHSVAEAALQAAAAAVIKLGRGDLTGCLENARAALSVSRQHPAISTLALNCILRRMMQLNLADIAAAAPSSAIKVCMKEVVPELLHLSRQQQHHVGGLGMPLRPPPECQEQGGSSAGSDARCAAVLDPGLVPDLVVPIGMLQDLLHLMDRKMVRMTEITLAELKVARILLQCFK